MFASPGAAQNARFEAAVDRNPVGIGEQFTLTLTLSNAGMGGGKNLQLPDLGKFHIMSGPNQSSSVQIINGAVSSTFVYTYILQPREIGTFTIGAVSIEVEGALLKSAPIQMTVVKAATRPQQQQPADQTVQLGDNLFLRASVDRSSVRQGEQINLSFKLYTRVRVLNYAVTKSPNITGFWSEDVEIPKNITLMNESVNGKQYQVGVIKRLALFPTQAGTLDISPMEVQTTIQLPQSRSNDPFEMFFRDPFGRNATYTIASEPLRVRVEPLPPGAPEDFKGAIGQFAMSTTLDRKTTRTNEPVSFKVTISGTGNIKLLEAPSLEIPPDFEQYSPKVSETINKQQTRISGSKTFEYLLIPRYPGLKIIKPVTMSYYDLAKREYVRLRSPQIELNVEQGATTVPQAAAGVLREDVRLLSQDIRFIKLAVPSFSTPGALPFLGGGFLVLMILPLGGVAGAYVYTRHRRAELLDEAGFRNRRAIKVAQKGLREAERLLKAATPNDAEPLARHKARFFAEISRALWHYLGDKLGIPQAEFSMDEAIRLLTARGVPGDLTQSLQRVLEVCDMARFAPTSMGADQMHRAYDDARRLIIELERTLRSR
jgi:hypothetical protein